MATLYVSPQGNNSNSGTSWAQARQTLASALSISASGDQIWVAAGTYDETLTLVSGVSLYGGFAGTETALDQRAPATQVTVIDGGGSGAVITVPANAVNSTRIDGFTIQHGHKLIVCNSGSAPVINGNILTDQYEAQSYTFSTGAVYSTSASPTITNNLFTNNTAAASFPGMNMNAGAVYASGGAPVVVNNTFYGNKVQNEPTVGGPTHGGALYASSSDITFANNIVDGNSVTGGIPQGGGIWISDGSPILSTNCFWSNHPSDRYGAGAEPGDLAEDPMFYNVGASDFSLQYNSPCVGAGNSTLLPAGDSTDLDGSPRIVDSTVDMGALEYQGTPRVLPIEVTPGDGLAPVRITMQGQTPSAYIAYTTDGSQPNANSTRYDGEFLLSSPATVKAAGYQDGWNPSPIVTADFTTATVIRVAPQGDDANDGSSWSEAKQTLEAAVSAAGDATAIWVATGTYRETFAISKSIFVFGGFGGWETALDQRDPVNHLSIMDGGGHGTLITFNGGAKSNSGVSGMVLQNGDRGVLCNSGSAPAINGNTIRNMSTQGPEWGNFQYGAITLMTSDAIVTSNLIHNVSYTGNPVSDLWVGGIYANGGTPQILGNTVNSASGKCNVNATRDLAGGIVCQNSDAVVANNIVTNCTSSYYQGYHGASGGGICVSGGAVTVAANCTYGNSPSAYYGISASGAAVEANPLYMDSGSGNYRLQSGSPCLAAGSTSVLPSGRSFDLQGLPRVVGGAVDMGAYETQLSEPPILLQGSGALPAVLAAQAPEGSTIRYTTDGSTPAVTSPVFTVPLLLDRETEARLVAFAADGSESHLVEARFAAPLATLFVSPSGSDSNNGSSWGQAFATVSHALSQTSGGDQLWVAAGTYSEKISIPAGVSVLGGFVGTETSADQRDWASHVTILDGGGGGTVASLSTDVASSTVLDGFTVQNGTYGVVTGGSGASIVSHNIVRDHSGSWNGQNMIQNAGAVQLKGGFPLLANNLITGNSYTNGFTGSGVRAGGVQIAGGTPMLVNNTIVGNSLSAPGAVASGALGAGIWIASGDAILENNIVADNNASADGGGTVGGISKTGGSATLDYNCVYGNQGSNYAGVTAGAHGISQDPQFVDSGSADYQLAAGSPCIDAGSNAAPALMSKDLADQDRVDGASVDMGAYENQS